MVHTNEKFNVILWKTNTFIVFLAEFEKEEQQKAQKQEKLSAVTLPAESADGTEALYLVTVTSNGEEVEQEEVAPPPAHAPAPVPSDAATPRIPPQEPLDVTSLIQQFMEKNYGRSDIIIPTSKSWYQNMERCIQNIEFGAAHYNTKYWFNDICQLLLI